MDRAVAEAHIAALQEVVVSIPEVLKVQQQPTEIKFTTDGHGKITGAVTKPKH